MFPEPAAVDELARLAALHRLALLDTLPEPVFDAITAAAAQACGVPISLVSLIDERRQWLKSQFGVSGTIETPRDVAFCDHAIRGEAVLEIGDAALDPRFAANPLVTGDPHIRFYAGAPIVLPGGERIGTVCVLDRVPRQLDDTQRGVLAGLARIAGAAIVDRALHVETTAALQASELRYRGIVEEQTELISLASPDGVLRFVNAAYARHFGLDAAQMIGHDLLEFVDERDRDAVRAHLASVYNQPHPITGTNRMRTADGRVRWIAWSNRPLIDAQGTLSSVQSVGRDVTEQRVTELALEESERRYRSLYEATPALLQSVDHDGKLVSVSDSWLEVFGFTRDEVIGRTAISFLTPESQRHAREVAVPAFVRTGRSHEVAYDMVCKSGRVVNVLLSAVMERDDLGRQLRSMSVLQDITEKNRLAAKLERALAHLTAVVDNVPALLCRCDASGVVRFVNREFQAAVGLPLDQLIGLPLREVFQAVDPTGLQRFEPHLVDVMRGRREEFELGLLTTAGLRQFRTTLVPEDTQPGQPRGFYAMAFDVTGRKALELRLSDSEHRYRSLSDYLNSGFALHEIVVDDEGRPVDYRYLAINAAFTALSGLDALTAIGRCVTELFPGIEADPADWIGVYGRVVQTGEPTHFEQHSMALDRWFEVVAYRPAPGQFAVIAQDITDRKSAAEQLVLSEQRLRLLLDAVHGHSMVLLDASGHIERWNAGAQRINGYAADEILGQHHRRFFDATEIARGDPENQLATASAHGRFANEGWRVRRDGSRFWAAVTVTAVRDLAGRLKGFVEVTRDLSERQRRQDLLLRVADLSSTAMLLLDSDGVIVYVNARAASMFGYGRDELIGQPHEGLFMQPLHAAGGAGLPAMLGQVDARSSGASAIATGRRKDGSAFDAEVGLSAFDAENGRVILAAVTDLTASSDVTEPRDQAQRLPDAQSPSTPL